MECEPNSLMEFSNIYARFLSNILEQLSDDEAVFKIYFAVDCVWMEMSDKCFVLCVFCVYYYATTKG